MKNIKLLTFGLLLLVLTGSCKKFVEGYEKDPNGLLETNTEQIMQGVLLEQQFFLKDDGMRLAMLWLNQATGSDRQYVAFNDWNNVGNNQLNSPWGEVYTVVGQARIMEDLATDVQNFKARGIAKLYRAWAGGTIALLWGDVPFSQAGLNEQYPDPAYDNQADVLNQVQDLLDEAIADLGGQGIIYDNKDLYYGGDANKWVNVAHALKARFYLAVGDYANAKSEAQQGIASADDDLIAPYDVYPGSYSRYNPMFQFDVYNREGYIGETGAYASQLLQARDNNDETSRLYYNYIPDAGILNSYPGYWWLGHDGKFAGPQFLLTYGEMLLIQAEAEARINGVAAALPIYNQYRTMLNSGYGMGTFDWGNVYPPYTIADFQTGGSQYQNGDTELQAFLRELMEERYVYFIGDYMAFVDHARSFNDSNVPNNYMQLKGNGSYTGQPLRFIYPQAEIDSNDNFPGNAPDINTPLPIFN